MEYLILHTSYTMETYTRLPIKHKLFIMEVIKREIGREKRYADKLRNLKYR